MPPRLTNDVKKKPLQITQKIRFFTHQVCLSFFFFLFHSTFKYDYKITLIKHGNYMLILFFLVHCGRTNGGPIAQFLVKQSYTSLQTFTVKIKLGLERPSWNHGQRSSLATFHVCPCSLIHLIVI